MTPAQALKSIKRLSPEKQMVSPEPDVFVEQRTSGDEFLLVACDGVFDVLTNEDTCFHIRQVFDAIVPTRVHVLTSPHRARRPSPPPPKAMARTDSGEESLEKINESLLDECLRKQSRDNMSSILVVFPAAWDGLTRVHVSARYIMKWKPDDVSRWLQLVGYGEVRGRTRASLASWHLRA